MKRHLIIFGGFHDNPLRGGSAKYFNDVHAFDTQEMRWKKLEITGVKAPSTRSGCNMFALSDGRIVVYGGYCKENIKKTGSGKKGGTDSSAEVGKTLGDMFLLVPDKHDESMTKWRWHNVKQTGDRPNLRSGIAAAVVPNSNKAIFFGGVNDEAETNESDDDDEFKQGSFYNDLYILSVENEKATWQKVEPSGDRNDKLVEKKRRRVNLKDKTEKSGPGDNYHLRGEEEDNSNNSIESEDDIDATSKIGMLEIDVENKRLPETAHKKDEGSSIRVVEDGAFTISSTIIHSVASREEGKTSTCPNKGSTSRGEDILIFLSVQRTLLSFKSRGIS